MFEKRIGHKPGKSSPSVRVGHRNRPGKVELEFVGRGPLMFAKFENGATKSCQQIYRRKNKNNVILA